MISFPEARRRTLAALSPLPAEDVPVAELPGRVLAEPVFALVDSPSCDVSLKDGFAVASGEIVMASPEKPVRLKLVGLASAGRAWDGRLQPGAAVRVLSGAPIPAGAQSVVSDEFAREENGRVWVSNHAQPGRNILTRGADVARGQALLPAGTLVGPSQAGPLASGGHSHAPAHRLPQVGIIATGDEVVAPGRPLPEGSLYASNLVTLAAWCRRYGLGVKTLVVPDSARDIRAALREQITRYDALMTSGGAWQGDRDLVVQVLESLGWRQVYHRVRMGPGKAVGFGELAETPVFCLPGGPPSNHVAFLQLALPGLLRLAGRPDPGLPTRRARLAERIIRRRPWTQFIHGRLQRHDEGMRFHLLQPPSRLQMISQAQALLALPEGVDELEAGAEVEVQVLSQDLA